VGGACPAYESLAIELVTNPEKIAAIKRTLAHNRLTKSLFERNTNVEAAYTAMHQGYRAGLAPCRYRGGAVVIFSCAKSDGGGAPASIITCAYQKSRHAVS
jgi:hypothetical protein